MKKVFYQLVIFTFYLLALMTTIAMPIKSSPLGNFFRHVVYVSHDGRMLFKIFDNGHLSQIYLSLNAGKTWSQILQEKLSFRSVYLSSENRRLYLGGYEDSATSNIANPKLNYLSADNENFGYADIDAIYIPKNNQTIYMGGQDSDDDAAWLFRGTKEPTDPEKIQWTTANITHCTAHAWNALNVNDISGNQKTVYLANITLDSKASGICMSQDGGQSWQMAKNFPQSNAASVYAIDHGVVYAAGYDEDGKNSTLYMSHDAGDHWERIGLNKARGSFITSINGSVDGRFIYVGTENKNPTLGGLWIQKNQQFSKVIFPDKKHYNVESISSSDSGQIVAASCENGVLWLSQDYGSTWYQG